MHVPRASAAERATSPKAALLLPVRAVLSGSCAGSGWQVRKYAAVFWQRYKELPDHDRHVKNIEKGEARIKRQSDIMHAIASKLDRYRNPWQVRQGPRCHCPVRLGGGHCSALPILSHRACRQGLPD